MKIITVNVPTAYMDAIKGVCYIRECNSCKVKSETENNDEMQNITITLPDLYIYALLRLQEGKIIPSRSEGVRYAIRHFLRRERGILSLLGYDREEYKGDRKVYNSRSALVRVAVRDWLIMEFSELSGVIPSLLSRSDDDSAKNPSDGEIISIPIKFNEEGEVIEEKKMRVIRIASSGTEDAT